MPSLPAPAPSRPGRLGSLPWLLAALLLPLLLTLALHALSLRPWVETTDSGLRVLEDADLVDDSSLLPPDSAAGLPLRLPYFQPAPEAQQHGPRWLLLRFRLDTAALGTWSLALAHRTPVLVYLDGRLLANTVPLAQADLPPRNLQIGDQRLEVSVPADWLYAGEHQIAVRVGAAGASGASLSRLTLGPTQEVSGSDRPRRFWLALRVSTALSAAVIGTLLLFAWLVDRRERLYLWSAVQVLMLMVLLLPYVLGGPLLPSPWWRMVLDAADLLAKGLAPVIIAAWAAPQQRQLQQTVQRLAFGWLALALPVDLWAAWRELPWTDFAHPWPWWALAGRLLMLALAVAVAARALQAGGSPRHFGTTVLAGLALWIWIDVSLFAIVLPGLVSVVDLNVVAYAGWALWVALLLHRRLVDTRRQEARLRSELAGQLAQRSEELRAQFAALQRSEQARSVAAERERLLQEMHDGVGAQLTSARMLASSGQLAASEMVDALDECLREMRLAVDALSVTDGDLALLLATLRHRLEPALRAGGILLDWRVEDAPRVSSLQGAGGRELARIVQEALSNSMHHAGATRVSLATRRVQDGGRLQIVIADNGRGMPVPVPAGRGLRNMRQRAERIRASITWQAPAPPARGTECVIELPLDALDAPA